MIHDREKVPLILRRTERGLEPRSRLAADLLAGYALHSDVEVTVRKRRSSPQLRLYWSMLHKVVEATDCAASAEHLHESCKLALGFVTPITLMDGRTVYIPDSAAMGKMDAAEFKRFFDAVVKLLSERFGFDPLAFNDAEAA